jgi:hypothetical protein
VTDIIAKVLVANEGSRLWLSQHPNGHYEAEVYRAPGAWGARGLVYDELFARGLGLTLEHAVLGLEFDLDEQIAPKY